MKKIRKKKETDYEIKFWKDWLNADSLKREKLVKNLMIYKMFINNKIKDKNLLKMTVPNILNSYFEDIESAVYTKIRLESKK